MNGCDHRSISLVALLVLAAVFMCLAKWRLDVALENHFRDSSAESSRAVLQRQIVTLRKGDTTLVTLYGTVETDSLLEELYEADEIRDHVEALWLGLTDVSDSGIAIVQGLSGLTRLYVIGGAPSISDIGLRSLAGHPVLQELSLTDTRVTPAGVRSLVDVPNLRVLVLASRHTHVGGDNGFDHLDVVQSIGRLGQIKALHLDGPWSDADVVRTLRHLLPHVVITTGCKGADDQGIRPQDRNGGSEGGRDAEHKDEGAE